MLNFTNKLLFLFFICKSLLTKASAKSVFCCFPYLLCARIWQPHWYTIRLEGWVAVGAEYWIYLFT